MSDITAFAAIALLILAAGFFAGTEIAYASVSTVRLRSRYQKKSSLMNFLAVKISENYEEKLGAVLIGSNLANIAASSVATLLVVEALGAGYAWVATLVMTFLIVTFGEVIPKVIATTMPEQFSVAVSVPIYIFSVLLKPVTFVISAFIGLVSKLWEKGASDPDAVSEDDLENILDIVEDEGVLDEDQADLLQNALDFDEVLAYEIITPRVDMVALDIRDPYEINLGKIEASIYSRLPVYEDTPDNIIGILHLNRFYKELVGGEKVNIRSLLRPVVYVHKTMPIPDVLEKMKETKSHLVIVLDEYGGTMGMLTMEDVLEQLVGEIWDETDEIEREFVCLDDTHFEAVGDMRIYDFFDEFDIDIAEDEDSDIDNTTVGGWTVTMLEGEVREGDSFRFENLLVTVLKAEEHRVERVGVEVMTPEETEEEKDE